MAVRGGCTAREPVAMLTGGEGWALGSGRGMGQARGWGGSRRAPERLATTSADPCARRTCAAPSPWCACLRGAACALVPPLWTCRPPPSVLLPGRWGGLGRRRVNGCRGGARDCLRTAAMLCPEMAGDSQACTVLCCAVLRCAVLAHTQEADTHRSMLRALLLAADPAEVRCGRGPAAPWLAALLAFGSAQCLSGSLPPPAVTPPAYPAYPALPPTHGRWPLCGARWPPTRCACCAAWTHAMPSAAAAPPSPTSHSCCPVTLRTQPLPRRWWSTRVRPLSAGRSGGEAPAGGVEHAALLVGAPATPVPPTQAMLPPLPPHLHQQATCFCPTGASPLPGRRRGAS